jgi:hypothetical protein
LSAPPTADAGINSPLKSIPAVPPGAAPPEPSTGFGRWLAVLGIAVVIVALVGYRVLARDPAPPPPIAATAAPEPVAAPAAPTPAAVEAPPNPGEAPSASASASSTVPLPLPVPDHAPSSSAAPDPSPSASAEPAAASADSHTVTFKSLPAKARFYHFGKEVGTAPFSLEFKPGERHSYEVGLPGYITRKVTVDGSKPEITVGLRKNSR